LKELWDTLQSRLPVEFKIHVIDTMEAANAFLLQFIVVYNEKFGVEPENSEPAFRPLDSNIDRLPSFEITYTTVKSPFGNNLTFWCWSTLPML
jgi:hypothetical protein